MLKLNAVLKVDGQLTLIGKAAKHGMLGVVKYLRSKNLNWETGVSMDFISIAANYGHLDCLMYAAENSCIFDVNTCYLAAMNGHVSCLKYFYEHGAPIRYDSCEAAVRNGHIGCVEYLVRCKAETFQNNKTLSKMACRVGNVEMLHCLLNTAGCPADAEVASAAAAFDRIECLNLLANVGCPFDKDTLYVAVHCGAMECMKYLYEASCPWDDSIMLICCNNSLVYPASLLSVCS